MQKEDPSERAPLMLAVILGGLCAIGPLAIDMYLPALPQIATEFAVDDGMIQFSLMAFLAGLTFGQLLCGPLSDRFGRKPLIVAGLGLFVLSSLGCAAAGDITLLNGLRFLQGLGGSIGMVMAFAVTRDLYSGLAAARLLSLIVMLLGIAPVVAPMLGSVVIEIGSWRIIFVLLGLFGALFIGLTIWKLPETRSLELRQAGKLSDSAGHYATLLTSRRFMPFVLASSAAQGAFFAYLSASSSVYMTTLELTPTQYSLAFGLNALGLMITAKITPAFLKRLHPHRLLLISLIADLIAGALLLALSATGRTSLLPVATLLFVIVAVNGVIMPLTSMLALESFGYISGTAAALMGALRFAAGAIASGLTAAFADGSPVPMASVMATCSLIAIVIAVTTFPPQEDPAIAESTKLSAEESA